MEVTASFENPFTATAALEAVYIFPLTDEAAFDYMLIGKRSRVKDSSFVQIGLSFSDQLA